MLLQISLIYHIGLGFNDIYKLLKDLLGMYFWQHAQKLIEMVFVERLLLMTTKNRTLENLFMQIMKIVSADKESSKFVIK